MTLKKAKGLAKEAIGNVPQGVGKVGKVTDDDKKLRAEGKAQEEKGAEKQTEDDDK